MPPGPGLPGQIPSADSAVLAMLIDDLGRWLAAEYTAVRRLIVKSSTTSAHAIAAGVTGCRP